MDWLNPLPRDHFIADIDFPTSSIGYLVGQGGMMLKTTDAGKTFVAMGTGHQTLLHVRFFDEERGIVLGPDGFIMNTGDGGETWNTQNVGSSDFTGLCLHPSGSAIAVGEFGTLLRSTDHGESWTLENSGQTSRLGGCQFLGLDTVYATATGLLLKSMNGGRTWKADTLFTEFQPNLPWSFDLRHTHFTNTGVGYALDGEVPVKSTDGLATWSTWGLVSGEFGPPRTILDMAVAPKGSVHLVGWNGAIFRGHLDEPTTWTISPSGLTTALVAVDFPADDTGYAAGELGQILRTVDGGVTWQSLSNAVTREDLKAVHFVDKDRGFAVGAAGTMLKTSDGGTNWSPVAGAAVRDLWGVHFLDQDIGCVVGEGGTALWTRDGGVTWHLGGTGIQATLVAVRVIDSLTAYAGAPPPWSTRALIKTVDGGRTWTPIPLSDYGIVPGWDIGDSLYFTGTTIFPRSPDMAFIPPGNSLYMRSGNNLAWRRHDFTGLEESVLSQSNAGEALTFGVGQFTVFRIDVAKRKLEYRAIRPGQSLRALHCPETGACIAVGDKGLILKISMP